MTSHRHSTILGLLRGIDIPPLEDPARSAWVRAENHLQILRENSMDSEVILYASSRPIFISTVVARKSDVTPPDHDGLLDWSCHPYAGRTYYEWDGIEDTAKVELDASVDGTERIRHQQNLVFIRDVEGVPGTTYYELLQEFAHAEGIHWREERHAYCNIDENGDWRSVVSVTGRSDEGLALVTCQRDALERYLAATNSVLVRFFDFTMIPNREDFRVGDWGSQQRVVESDTLFYNQCLHPLSYGYVRGIQLLPVLSHQRDLFRAYNDSLDKEDREYASFIINDFRNGKITEVSAAPRQTTNYFDAENNSLPFETSPAFFGPEVLSRYKADRDKYIVSEENRTIDCRGAWYLKRYDVNDEGQVHALLCDLRWLPYREQLYWKSHNEEPKGFLSRRTFENYFLGEWSSYTTPLERILDTLGEWVRKRPDWWQIGDERSLHRLNTPITDSRDEWGTAFLELSKVVIEGFRKSPIQEFLRRENIPFENDHGTLTLLEHLLTTRVPENERPLRLKGLKEAQLIRTKAHSHSAGSEADKLAKDALTEHGTYRGHFEWVCGQIADELEAIGVALRAA